MLASREARASFKRLGRRRGLDGRGSGNVEWTARSGGRLGDGEGEDGRADARLVLLAIDEAYHVRQVLLVLLVRVEQVVAFVPATRNPLSISRVSACCVTVNLSCCMLLDSVPQSTTVVLDIDRPVTTVVLHFTVNLSISLSLACIAYTRLWFPPWPSLGTRTHTTRRWMVQGDAGMIAQTIDALQGDDTGVGGRRKDIAAKGLSSAPPGMQLSGSTKNTCHATRVIKRVVQLRESSHSGRPATISGRTQPQTSEHQQPRPHLWGASCRYARLCCLNAATHLGREARGDGRGDEGDGRGETREGRREIAEGIG